MYRPSLMLSSRLRTGSSRLARATSSFLSYISTSSISAHNTRPAVTAFPSAAFSTASAPKARVLEPAAELFTLLPQEDPALMGKHAVKSQAAREKEEAELDALEAEADANAVAPGPRVNPVTGEVNGPRGPEPTRYGGRDFYACFVCQRWLHYFTLFFM